MDPTAPYTDTQIQKKGDPLPQKVSFFLLSRLRPPAQLFSSGLQRLKIGIRLRVTALTICHLHSYSDWHARISPKN